MTSADVERRLTALESEVAALRKQLAELRQPEKWWQTISGTFKGDPAFLEAMRLGREYRDADRPKEKKPKRKPPRAARTGHGSRKPA
jgi:hypothetical protein